MTVFAGRRHRPDYSLVLLTGILLIIGLIVIYAISPALSYKLLGDVNENYFLYRQLINISVALVAFGVAAWLPRELWLRLLPFLIVASIISTLLLFVPALAISENGATRWIRLGPFSFQPAELLKLTVLIYLAHWFGRKNSTELAQSDKTLWPVAALVGIAGVVVVILQRDMGTMLVLTAMILGLFYASGAPGRHVSWLVGLIGVAGLLSILLFQHRLARLLTFLNPGSDILGAGYHINQALIAVGSGGLLGLGLGKSIQVYGYLPEAANDSIFAIWAEKFGFIGSIAVLALFGYLFMRMLNIAQRARDRVDALLAVGILVWIASHVVINVGAMLSLLPLTGITLPFLSYGGTSLVFMMTAMGMIFNISRYTTFSTNRKWGQGSYAHSGQRRR